MTMTRAVAEFDAWLASDGLTNKRPVWANRDMGVIMIERPVGYWPTDAEISAEEIE